MITFTWWGAATVAAIMTGTAAFIAYWSGYRHAIRESRAIIDHLRAEMEDLEDAIDDLEDHMRGHSRRHRLTNAEHEMFRAIIRYNNGH
jgi:type II secretory pathway component PulJ